MHLLDVPFELLAPFMQPPSLHLHVTPLLDNDPPQWKAWGPWDQHPAHFDLMTNLPAFKRALQKSPLHFWSASERHPQLNLAACLNTLVHRVLCCYPPPRDRVDSDSSFMVYWALALQGTNMVLHGTLGKPQLVTIHERGHGSHAPDRIHNPAHPDFWSLLGDAETVLWSSTPPTYRQGQLGISASWGVLSAHFCIPIRVVAMHARCPFPTVALHCTCRFMATWQDHHTSKN
jgi:hypothetical protein